MKNYVEERRRPATKMCRALSVLLVASGCMLFPTTNRADDSPLSPDQGYMLIRVKLVQGERINVLAMSNVDTEQIVRSSTTAFKPAGSNGWLALVAMPGGRYFWSEFETKYGSGVEANRNLNQRHVRDDPGSASDTFEIVSGAVNYVGDWNMRVVPSQRSRLDPIIEYDKSTLERYLQQYPEQANRYEIYLSIMGKEAISLQELAKITEE